MRQREDWRTGVVPRRAAGIEAGTDADAGKERQIRAVWGLATEYRRDFAGDLLLKKNDMTDAFILGTSFEIFSDYKDLRRTL